MLDRLKSIFVPTNTASHRELYPKPEGRIHARYELEDFSFIKLNFPIGHQAVMRDISFGGFALAKSSLELPEFSEPDIQGSLEIFGRSCLFKAKMIYEDKTKVGFQFVHQDDSVLVFMRSLLEDLRCGASLTLLDPILLTESFQKKYTVAFRGSGPIDLYIGWHNQSLTRALFTKRIQQSYEELRLSNDSIQTGRMVDEIGSPSQLVTDSRASREFIESTMQILAGAMIKRGEEQPLLLALYEKLQSEWNSLRKLSS